ncbi:MAG: hypothetical protein QOG30_2764 [Acidimicrobiaceae bacterium]|jgi:hypothetical protein
MALIDTFLRTSHFDERHRRRDTTKVDDVMAVRVRITEGLAPIAAAVAERLGPGFEVTVGSPTGGSIAVVAALGREATAFVHAQHPDALLLVVKRGATGHDDGAADYLNAGADQFLASGSLDEVALHIRALARRLRSIRSGGGAR